MKHYHYIFAGVGLASLMTVYRMAVMGNFSNTSILLIDPDTKTNNDRTWCYWQTGNSMWDSITFKKWESAIFTDEKNAVNLDFESYKYNMIRGIDFYSFVLAELKKHLNIEFVQQKVIDFADTGLNVMVKTETESYTCNKLLNNIYNPTLPKSQNKYPVLQQHFIGWHIKTSQPAFDPDKPVFMDFSIPQKGNTRFMYVLPFSETEAIVEYTLFSKDLLPEKQYEEAIQEYLENLNTGSYEIVGTERGAIPMTCYPFWKNNTKNILNIGTAGGWTKASTGYTFKNADKLSDRLALFLTQQDDFTAFYKKNRYWFYDLLLLDILNRKNEKGALIFSSMFKKGSAYLIFKFLDEESSFTEDLTVISKCPKGLFISSFFRNIAKL